MQHINTKYRRPKVDFKKDFGMQQSLVHKL